MGGDSPKALASSRLREMELESEIEEQELQHALGGGTATPAPLEVALKASNKAKVVDGRDEKDSLLRKRQEPEPSAVPVEQRKLIMIVAATASIALLILWLLFRGKPSVRDETFDFLPPQMVYSQLVEAQPDNPCPPQDWLPPPCGSQERLKSKSIHIKCQEWFNRYGYTLDVLKGCKLIELVT